MKKTLFTLDIGGYIPELTRLTFPLMRYYARKIGADFCVIKDRIYPDWPIAVEKFQVYTLAQQRDDEWALFFDADTLIHPETPDWTRFLPKDTVAHNGSDWGGIRWRTHPYFLRDGRNIGSCNWCAIGSEWCWDFWQPPEPGLTAADCVAEIYPTMLERQSGVIDAAHLIDDYLMSRNVARYGLKFTTLLTLQKQIELEANLLWHQYLISPEEKIRQAHEVLWGGNPPALPSGEKNLGWNLPEDILPRP